MPGQGRRFQKGEVHNPRGRPRTGTSVAEYVRKLSGDDGRAYVDKLHALAVGEHDNFSARLSAINILLDRGWGRPPQAVTLGGQLDTVTTVVHRHEPA
jgi:hypothetical protein